jgi:cysteine synthase A
VDAISTTPLIKLRRASELTGSTILGKTEFMNDFPNLPHIDS